MRPVLWWTAAVVVTVAGVAGLARGATPQSSAGGGTTGSPPIVVTDAYVRQPASPDVAAAYFTVYNTTGVADTLVSAASGAGEESILHTETNGSMTDTPAGGVVIPAHGSVVFKPTTGHVMIEKLLGTLLPGQSVDIELTFLNAGQVVFQAPVIGIYATPPTGAAVTSTGSPSVSPSVSTPAAPTAGATSS